MQIQKDKVVSIHYTLTDDAGKVLDSSTGRGPLHFIQGHGNLIPGLEEALEGKVKTDKLKTSIPPEKGYGVRIDEMIHQISRSQFEEPENIEVGMQFQSQMDHGMQHLTITKIEGDKITMDGNHPLAGQTLHFDVDVVDVREASKEELEHGHVHSPEGHHHH
ncbi:MAG: peptidylprolyl isomerase [Bacteroidales bacterium]|jgi:FKBP-type peptidyl-prolyl cis-trans isomerase SlyD